MSTAKIQFTFGTLAGAKTWTFSNADSDATDSAVKNAAQVMIANGSIYKYPPLTAESAKIVITTEKIFDLSS